MALRSCAPVRKFTKEASIGWHCLSDATCLMRPRLFRVFFFAPRITIIC